MTSIGQYAFVSSSITEVNLGSGIKEIGEHAFSSSIPPKVLDKLNVKDITAYLNCGYGIAANKFYINGKRITELVIPEGVTQIPDYAFYGSQSLTSVTMANGVKVSVLTLFISVKI